MAHHKDYRKPPVENYRETIKEEEGNTKQIKEWALMGILGLFLIGGIVWFSNQVKTIPPITTEVKKEKVETKAKRKAQKKRIIADSYEEVMILGELGTEMEDLREAADRYYDAKTIYPYKIEPRVKLSESYLERCRENPNYCLRTARELTYAYMYVNDNTSPKLIKKLDAIQAELNKIYTVKDSAMLYVH